MQDVENDTSTPIHSSLKLPNVYEMVKAQESTRSVFDYFSNEKDTFNMNETILQNERKSFISYSPLRSNHGGSPRSSILE